MEITKCEKYKLLYIGDGKYKICEFLPATIEWWELSGTATKNVAIKEYLRLIFECYGGDVYARQKAKLELMDILGKI